MKGIFSKRDQRFLRKLKKFIILATMLFLAANPCRAGGPCEDMIARLKAGAKIPSGRWWDCLSESDKEKDISDVIKILKERDGVMIKNPASYYVKEIDAFRSESPILKNSTVRYLLSVTAALSYDFDEGIPKEETLKKFMLAEDADGIIERRKKESTPEGMMPASVMSGIKSRNRMRAICSVGEQCR